MADTFPAGIAYTPSYSSSLAKKYRVLKAEFGEGYTQRSRDGINSIQRTYNAVWNNILSANALVIKDFLDALGGADSFEWQHPEDTAAARWTCPDGHSETFVSVDTVNLSAVFVEEFDS